MPRKTLKRKYLDLIRFDTIIEVQYAKDGKEVDAIIDDCLENIDAIMSERYMVPRYKIPKSTEWFTRILPNHNDDRFLHVMRVSRKQFNRILSLIFNDTVFNPTTRRKSQIAVDTQLCIALYKFGNYGGAVSYGQVAGKFAIGDGRTNQNIMNRIIIAILNLKSQFIYWPNAGEREELAITMAKNLPGCVGYVDGTHVNLAKRPTLFHADDYYSRKDRYGLHLQVICDQSLKIRHYVVGKTASVHDAKVFNECVIGTTPGTYLTNGQWIAGDGAYRLTEYVITPFRNNSPEGTARHRRIFNKFFSHYRIKIEHTFKILKEKFASLKELKIRIDSADSHIFACRWIEACLILYNILWRRPDLDYFDIFKKKWSKRRRRTK